MTQENFQHEITTSQGETLFMDEETGIILPEQVLAELRATYIIIAHHERILAQLRANQSLLIAPFVDLSKDWHVNLDTGELVENAPDRNRPDLRSVEPDGDEDRSAPHSGDLELDSENEH